MTVTVQPATIDDEAVTMPGDILDDNWVNRRPNPGAPTTVEGLRATYGTADPDELAARFAIDEDVATARALAASR
ncbi:hypothetical protein OOJ91_11935 [Micromonospora lupini]|uniref:hypothetical protein n=1 Tax=Micromonospora lupini TaxID=285679 RepID=UPI0022525193|nr:hypothetical protein [Micromonospora lupini]MCX5066587.1 hypothetical protein [Micromonospora lupini]